MGGCRTLDVACEHGNTSNTPLGQFFWRRFQGPTWWFFCVISIAGQRTFESTNHHYFNLQLLPLSRFLPIMVTIWQSQKEIGDVLQAADEAEAKWFPLTAGGQGDKKSFACINHSTFVVFATEASGEAFDIHFFVLPKMFSSCHSL